MVKQAIKAVISGSIALGIFSGCGPKIKLAEYKKAPISKAEFIPSTSELTSSKTKVVVLALQNASTDIVSRVNAGKTVSDGVEVMVTKSKMVEIVDRTAAERLNKEIALIEMKGDSANTYNGPAIADMAVSGSVTSGGTSAQYTQASTSCNKDGKCYTTPASCTYKGEVSGTLKVYQLPDLRLLEALPFSGSASYNEEGGCKSYDRDGLVSKAASNAPNSVKVNLLNTFSPKGYITDKQVKDDKSIFLLQIGSTGGAAYNLRVKIYTIQSNTNPLTGIISKEEILLGEGVITDQITPNTSWMLIEDKVLADQIRLGDYIKFNHQKGFMDLLVEAGQ